MANIAAIASVGRSLMTYLDNAYRNSLFPNGVTRPECAFALVSSGQVHDENDPGQSAVRVVISLYRVTTNAHLRTAGRPTAPEMRPPPLSLDLHYLLSFWSESPGNEHLVLAWTMRQLHLNPVLDASTLTQEANWNVEDVVQLIPEELSTEDLMRIWDTFTPKYRLSVSYIARVVRLDPDALDFEHGPVVATRFDYAAPAPPP